MAFRSRKRSRETTRRAVGEIVQRLVRERAESIGRRKTGERVLPKKSAHRCAMPAVPRACDVVDDLYGCAAAATVSQSIPAETQRADTKNAVASSRGDRHHPARERDHR